MKPLTRYAMGTGMNIEPHMAPWPEGKYYRVDQVDARIAELEARALRADDALHREAEWRKQAEAECDAARAANSVKVGDMMDALYRTYLSLTAGDSYDAERYMRQEFWRRMAVAAIDAARGAE